MAKHEIEVPNGEYCSDKRKLSCMYKQAHQGEHFCPIFGEYLSKEEITTDGNRMRVIRKCRQCFERMTGNVKDAEYPKPDKVKAGWSKNG